MANYFIGFKPSKEDLQEIEKRVQLLRNLPFQDYFTYVQKENIHFTLLFLGRLEQKEVQKIKELLQGYQLQSESQEGVFNIKRFKHIGKPPRLISLSGRVNPQILELRDSLRKEIRNLKIDLKEREEFLPHITVVRFSKPRETLPLPKFPAFSITLSKFSLLTRTEVGKSYLYIEA